MNAIVLYKSKYGSTKTYAKWIAKELSCEAKEAKGVKIDDLLSYDTIIYGILNSEYSWKMTGK